MLTGSVTWAEWHECYSSRPEFRDAITLYHDLRRRARINRQLANAVTIGGSSPPSYRQDSAGKWFKYDKPAARWAKEHKARFRRTYATEIKQVRARLGSYTLPKSKVPIGKTAARVWGCESEADAAAAQWILRPLGQWFEQQEGESRDAALIRLLWSLRHSQPSARPILAGAARRLRVPLEPKDLQTPKYGVPDNWTVTRNYDGPDGFEARSPIKHGGQLVRTFNARGRLLRQRCVVAIPLAA